MGKSIYTKFILGYIIFGLIGFITVALFSQKMTYNYLVDQNKSKLNAEAVLIAETYEDKNAYFTDLNKGAVNDLSYVGEFIQADIWLTDTEGLIVSSSANKNLISKTISDFTGELKEGDYEIGYFNRMFNVSMLSVIAPIHHNYKIIGYILIHYPMSEVTSSTNDILNIVYITALVIFILSLVILLVFTRFVYIPLKNITKGANEYAKGNLSYHIELKDKTHDEVGLLADTLNYMAGELADSELRQRKFISNISHDFRSPLTSIRGFIMAILDGTISREDEDKYLKRVVSETDRLSGLTEGMIDLGRMETASSLNKSSFDINETIRGVCNSNENTAGERGISFELIFENVSEPVYGDEEKIKQVLYNLVDNAIKFSDNDSVIHISTYLRGKKIFTCVKDEGVGIAKDELRKIWDRFYKNDTSRGRDKNGSGLGLSIARDIISAHGETIDVVSTEGAGTEFTFSLPVG